MANNPTIDRDAFNRAERKVLDHFKARLNEGSITGIELSMVYGAVTRFREELTDLLALQDNQTP